MTVNLNGKYNYPKQLKSISRNAWYAVYRIRLTAQMVMIIISIDNQFKRNLNLTLSK